MYKTIAFLSALFFLACQKDKSIRDSSPSINQSSITDDFDYAADSLQFIVDDNEGDNDYIAEGTSPIKIESIASQNVMPSTNLYNSSRAKYPRRSIISASQKNRFTLYGNGFLSQSDTSKVIAFIKDDSIAICDIISWTDEQIVVDLPVSESLNSLSTFSLRFKVFRANASKKIISNRKSRACISETKCRPYFVTTNKTFQQITRSYLPQTGDYLKRLNGGISIIDGYSYFGVVRGGRITVNEVSTTGKKKIYTYFCTLFANGFTGYIGESENVAIFEYYAR